MSEARVGGNPGDTVQLADTDGGFYDTETALKVVRGQQVKLGDTVGRKTNEAIWSGALLVVKSGKPQASGLAGGDKPETAKAAGKKKTAEEPVKE